MYLNWIIDIRNLDDYELLLVSLSKIWMIEVGESAALSILLSIDILAKKIFFKEYIGGTF